MIGRGLRGAGLGGPVGSLHAGPSRVPGQELFEHCGVLVSGGFEVGVPDFVADADGAHGAVAGRGTARHTKIDD